MVKQKEMKAEAWVQCKYYPSVLHKLRKGKNALEYDCTCLGVGLGGELKVGDVVVYEPPGYQGTNRENKALAGKG